MVRNEPNAHVRLYWRRKAQQRGLSPMQFVKLEAKAQGINYDILVSRSHPMVYYRQRKTVLLKTMRRFRKLSTPQLGTLFNRHHTSILYSLGRTGTAKRRKAGL
jgi:chromosomal replication initiation ATPase DnaA